MINAKPVLLHMGLTATSPSRIVEEIRDTIEEAGNPLKKANQIIADLTQLPASYTDLTLARHVAQYVAQIAVAHESFDAEETIMVAEAHSAKIIGTMPWAFVKEEATTGQGETKSAIVEGIDVKVAIKSDGKIKKGGKQILAAELYKKHVTESETPLSNQDFIKVLMKELGMTKAGATTYRYNLAKQFAK